MPKKITIYLICLMQSVFVHAGLESCKNLTKQSDLNTCASRSLNIANESIGKVYNNYLKDLSPQEQLKLKEAQRSWVQFKEKDCSFETAPVKNGSMYPYVLSACLIDRTEKRILELNNMANCKNGTEPSCL